MEQSIVDFITGGSWTSNILMFILFVLSVLAVYILVERLLILQNTAKEVDSFVKQMQQLMLDKKYQESVSLVKTHNSMAASILKKSLYTIGSSSNVEINEASLVIDTIGNSEIAELEKGFSLLASIAGGAPMIGFLGTVIGMVQSFYQMSSGGGDFEVVALSQGIYTALFTTVGGLIVGIIAYFSYNTLVAKVKKLTNTLETIKIDYIALRNHY